MNWDELEAPSILPLREVELEQYDIDSEKSLFLHIWSTSTNFSESNRSNRSIIHDSNHNITTNTFLENVSISVLSSLSSCSQILTLSKSLDITESEQVMQFGRSKQSTTKPIDYAWLNDPQNQHLRDEHQAKASKEPKQEFAVRACKINVRSNTLQNYQEAIVVKYNYNFFFEQFI